MVVNGSIKHLVCIDSCLSNLPLISFNGYDGHLQVQFLIQHYLDRDNIFICRILDGHRSDG